MPDPPPTTPSNRIKEIFIAASELAPAERAALLDRECAGDMQLRSAVESLLAANESAGDFLAGPTAGGSRVVAAERTGQVPRQQIGPYKLLQVIGEGGFGTVYLAEQETPVRRRVALKLIKLGMDTSQVIARFEAERQALAIMDHPNIARVFDAGATENGRPYFVMELVKGDPITLYCDQARLTTQQRLELFVPVCQAVQ
ncbi:MAG: protein kinase, partial [Anaerolineae bacterium]|nr:protein kinase [Phycisphaerae bacterium]